MTEIELLKSTGYFFSDNFLNSGLNLSPTVNIHFYENINIGGGSRLIENWTNLDGLYNVNITPSLFRLIPDASITHYYSSHFFEHISQKSTLSIFHEIYRTLKHGGVFRLCAPDIDEFVKQISFESHYFTSWVKSVWPDKPANIHDLDVFLEMGGSISLDDVPSPNVGHVWPQNYGVLFWMLCIAGFCPNNISKSSFQKSKIQDVINFNFDNRSNHTIFIECTK